MHPSIRNLFGVFSIGLTIVLGAGSLSFAQGTTPTKVELTASGMNGRIDTARLKEYLEAIGYQPEEITSEDGQPSIQFVLPIENFRFYSFIRVFNNSNKITIVTPVREFDENDEVTVQDLRNWVNYARLPWSAEFRHYEARNLLLMIYRMDNRHLTADVLRDEIRNCASEIESSRAIWERPAPEPLRDEGALGASEVKTDTSLSQILGQGDINPYDMQGSASNFSKVLEEYRHRKAEEAALDAAAKQFEMISGTGTPNDNNANPLVGGIWQVRDHDAGLLSWEFHENGFGKISREGKQGEKDSKNLRYELTGTKLRTDCEGHRVEYFLEFIDKDTIRMMSTTGTLELELKRR